MRTMCILRVAMTTLHIITNTDSPPGKHTSAFDRVIYICLQWYFKCEVIDLICYLLIIIQYSENGNRQLSILPTEVLVGLVVHGNVNI